MKIGDIELKGKVVLGPMAGVTTLAYREFMKPFGVALSYSEMISDCGIVYGNDRTYEYLKTSEVDRPVGLQLFGFSIENTIKAIDIVEKEAQYDILDINLGCPVYKVVKTGAGSAWLKRPQELYEYMSAVVAHSHKPVTAKIRLGWDDDSINFEEVVALLEKAGVAAITIHARTSKAGYSGTADYEKLAGLRDKMSVPLIISGDIFTPEQAKKAIDITHADMVMVARGGLGNPYLVTQINEYLEKGVLLPSPDVLKQVDYAEDFANRLIALKGEHIAIQELKGLLPHFFSGFPGYKKVRMEIAMNMKNEKDMRGLLNGIRRRATL